MEESKKEIYFELFFEVKSKEPILLWEVYLETYQDNEEIGMTFEKVVDAQEKELIEELEQRGQLNELLKIFRKKEIAEEELPEL